MKHPWSEERLRKAEEKELSKARGKYMGDLAFEGRRVTRGKAAEEREYSRYLKGEERGIAKEERGEAREEIRVGGEREKTLKKVSRVGEKVIGGALETPMAILKGISKINVKGMMPRGIRHPDSLIKNRDLYLVKNPKATPLGRFPENKMELYFGRSQRGMPEGTNAIATALKEGYDIEQLPVVTGLRESQISESLRWLQKKGLIKLERP